MSNRLFQGLVHQMRDTIDATIGVVDENATIIACSELSKIGTSNEFVSLDLSDSHDIFIRDGYTYKPFGSHSKPDYAVFVEGTDDMAAKYASIMALTLANIKQYYDEKYEKQLYQKRCTRQYSSGRHRHQGKRTPFQFGNQQSCLSHKNRFRKRYFGL